MRLPLLRLLPLLLALAALPALAQRGPAVPVESAEAQRSRIPVEIAANGTAASEAVVNVRTRVDGQIERVHVREGQMVKHGDVLFTLDRRLAEATLAQQEAQLARDRAQAQRAQADAQRYASLRGEGFAAQQRFEQAQAEAGVAAANVRASEALISYTRTLLDYATITAEADGRLGTLPVREGNFVRAAENTPIATITPMDPLVVRFAVPERWVPGLRDALAGPVPPRVRAAPPGDAGPPAEGQLVFMDSQVDPTTGTIALTARFPNATQRLWPGQWLSVVVTLREEEALTVPVQAVQQGQQGPQVFVLDADRVAHRRAVRVERVSGGRAAISGEVAPGDRVVVEGANLLTDGARTVERQPQPAGPRS
ncbi:efflux RND transporter periplasmic adaptor subunit [Falsiroseomonas sp. CW058]|uniref:efflux RND transporter periplasmic adaptor subunit n=1 Tax=Falsiroseomonas sp. CW058 TaxID=3388664 RepID=UPI003D31F5C3